MSRRSKRRKTAGKRPWLGKALAAVVVALVLAIGVGYGVLRSYLHSDAFRKFLSAEASETAGVTGEFGLFRWQGLALETSSFEATGPSLITAVRADDLHTEVSLDGVTRGVWEIRDSHARRLEISLDTTKIAEEIQTPTNPRPAVSKSKRPSWFPHDAELQGINIAEVAVKATLPQGPLTVSGVSFHAEKAGGKNSYRGELEGGSIRLPFPILPELRLDRARLRYQDQEAFLTDSTLNLFANGRIQSSGEWDMKSQRFSVTGNAYDLKCDEILKADWAKLLTGDLATTFTLGNPLGFSQASGKLTLKNGTLTALPMLDALAAYADTRRFRILALNDAHTDWRWKNGEISLSNLVLSSEGLVRLEGSLVIRGREIDGQFRLGLAPGTLATIPGAETDVFVVGERGLMWTPLHLTGTLDDPKEDLTDRLITAAGLRMFDQIPATGEQALKFTRSVIEESSDTTLKQGVKILEQGTGAVRDVTGILGDLLGSEPTAEPEKSPQLPASR
jgi:AsmA-like C-terminal region